MTKYKSKIEEIWQDQVDAGTWGREDLKGIIGGDKEKNKEEKN